MKIEFMKVESESQRNMIYRAFAMEEALQRIPWDRRVPITQVINDSSRDFLYVEKKDIVWDKKTNIVSVEIPDEKLIHHNGWTLVPKVYIHRSMEGYRSEIAVPGKQLQKMVEVASFDFVELQFIQEYSSFADIKATIKEGKPVGYTADGLLVVDKPAEVAKDVIKEEPVLNITELFEKVSFKDGVFDSVIMAQQTVAMEQQLLESGVEIASVISSPYYTSEEVHSGDDVTQTILEAKEVFTGKNYMDVILKAKKGVKGKKFIYYISYVKEDKTVSINGLLLNS